MKKLILLLFVLALSGIITWSAQAIPPSPPFDPSGNYSFLGDVDLSGATVTWPSDVVTTDKTIPDTHTKTGPGCFSAASGGNLGDCNNLQDVAYEPKLTCTPGQIKKWGESGWECDTDAGDPSDGLSQTKYAVLTNPQYCDETGALLQTTKTAGAKFGQCLMSNIADKTGNYAVYEWVVPPDIDTSIDLTARIYYRLGGADTAAHAYKLSLSSIAASASAAGSFGQEIAFNAAADGSGADGDIEITPALASAMATLTDWKSNITAGQLLLIKLARDGDDGTNDASTTDSYTNKVVISYGSNQ